MNRWSLLGALAFGIVFMLCAALRIDALDSRAVRFLVAALLFGTYCGLVIFGTSDKKRALSLSGQTLLGVALAFAIAALCKATPEGYVLAALLGLILGFTADMWVKHVPFP